MDVVERADDLTVHICADCGSVIHGTYVETIRNGCRVFLCPFRCQPAEERPFVHERDMGGCLSVTPPIGAIGDPSENYA